MINKFISSEHERRFLEISKIGNKDISYKTLYFAISGVDDLYSKRFKILSKDYRSLIIDFDDDDFINCQMSSSEKNILKLAINLFNGHFELNVSRIFGSLDSQNIKLCLNLIEFRFQNNM